MGGEVKVSWFWVDGMEMKADRWKLIGGVLFPDDWTGKYRPTSSRARVDDTRDTVNRYTKDSG